MLTTSTIAQKVLNSDLCSPKKEKLLAVIDTIHVKDIREQAMERLFDRENVVAGIDPYNCKIMMVRLMTTLAEKRASLVKESEVTEYVQRLEALFNFFDVLDHPDYDKIRDIEYVVENGEDTFDPKRPTRYLITVDEIYQGWCCRHGNVRNPAAIRENLEEPV